DFKDPRPEPYGPLDHSHARYKGLYLHGEKVILSYTAGDAKILELPGVEALGEQTVFTRTVNVGPSKVALTHGVAEVEKAKGSVSGAVATLEGSKPTLAGLAAAPKGVALEVKDGRILLTIAPHTEAIAFRVLIAQLPKDGADKFAALVEKSGDSLDLQKYVK